MFGINLNKFKKLNDTEKTHASNLNANKEKFSIEKSNLINDIIESGK